jgi:hypothetical protein
MVGTRGLEPLTPTVSRKEKRRFRCYPVSSGACSCCPEREVCYSWSAIWSASSQPLCLTLVFETIEECVQARWAARLSLVRNGLEPGISAAHIDPTSKETELRCPSSYTSSSDRIARANPTLPAQEAQRPYARAFQIHGNFRRVPVPAMSRRRGSCHGPYQNQKA